jgi:predicted enzyme related to lactoylglutathione lyase
MTDSKLPERASLEHLKRLAKRRLRELQRTDPSAKLADTQLELAREYGFSSWRSLRARVEGPRKNRIVSPAMRFIGVTDLDRSVKFYHDVLGFEVKSNVDGVELSRGPARIRLGKSAYSAPASACTTGRPPGSTVLFLESGDIAAIHSAVQDRGGVPSDVEKVNWIKMWMFEIRDPDGNAIWFGKSYHKEPDSPSRRKSQPPGLRQALPEMPFDNVPAAVAYYRDVLGFRINHQQDDLGVMDRDAITVLLIARTERHKGIGSFEVYVDDADRLHEELVARGAHILGPPVSHPWGLREFRILDVEGNRITFGQTFE